jgi:hypothetical protein
VQLHGHLPQEGGLDTGVGCWPSSGGASTFSIIISSITALSIMGLHVTFSISDSINYTAKQYCAIMLNVIMPSVVAP